MGNLSLITPQTKSADPLRAALADAQQEAAAKARQVDRQKAAISRTRASVRASETAIKTAEEGVAKAREAHAQALADAATADTAPPSSPLRNARAAVTDAQDEAEASKAALDQLKADLPNFESDLREAEIATEAIISSILAAEAQRVLDRAKEIARELAPLKNALAALWSDKAPGGTAEYLAHDRGRKPLAAVKADIATFFQTIKEINDRQPDPWTAARELLRRDAYAALPDFVSGSSDNAA